MDNQLRYKQLALNFLSNISLTGSSHSAGDISKSEKNVKIDVEEKQISSNFDSHSNHSKKVTESSLAKFKPSKILPDIIYQRIRKRNTSSSSLSSLNDDDKTVGLKQISTKQRMVMVTPTHRSSFSVYSILSFSKCVKLVKHDGTIIEKADQTRLRLISGNSSSNNDNILNFGLLQIPSEEDVSYQHLLKPIINTDQKSNLLVIPSKPQPQMSPIFSRRWIDSTKPPAKITDLPYDPNLLDDPDIITSRSKVVLNLPGYITTIVNYVRPDEIKIDINEQFRQKFPEVDLSLTKLRSLKQNIITIANKTNIDLWTVANAFVFFEMLVLKNLIGKTNRKLCCAASFVLSAKINDVKRNDLNNMIQELESSFKIHKRDILQYELYIFVALEFGLQLHDKVINVHYKRLTRNLC